MPCGCKAASSGRWVYRAPDGTETEKNTEVEARAMFIRAGHVGEVRPK